MKFIEIVLAGIALFAALNMLLAWYGKVKADASAWADSAPYANAAMACTALTTVALGFLGLLLK